MSDLFTGNIFVQLNSRRAWDPRTGWTVTRRWRGRQADIATASSLLRASSIRNNVEPSTDGGYDELEATYGVSDTVDGTTDINEPLADVWSMPGNDLEKSMWEFPPVAEVMAGLPDSETRATVKSLVESFVRGVYNVDNWPVPLTENEIADYVAQYSKPVLTLDIAGVMRGLIRTLLEGTDQFSVSQYVVKRSLTIAAGSSIQPVFVNVGRVFQTTEEFVAKEGSPSLWFTPPPGLWLKRTPTLSPPPAADKNLIEYEYWHADRVNGFIYEPAL